MTNFEKIKNMSIEEMAEMLNNLSANCTNENCSNCIYNIDYFCDIKSFINYLEKEAKE